MAISEAVETPKIPVSRDNRTWQILIWCESSKPVSQWSVTWHREVVQRDAQGNVVGDRIQSVPIPVTEGEVTVQVPLNITAMAPQLLQESFTDPATNKTMTGAEIMSMLAYIGDLRWQAERDARIAAEVARLEAQAQAAAAQAAAEQAAQAAAAQAAAEQAAQEQQQQGGEE